ncbi:hypothetical protein Bca4012_038033 [Brassica carinata]
MATTKFITKLVLARIKTQSAASASLPRRIPAEFGFTEPCRLDRTALMCLPDTKEETAVCRMSSEWRFHKSHRSGRNLLGEEGLRGSHRSEDITMN